MSIILDYRPDAAITRNSAFNDLRWVWLNCTFPHLHYPVQNALLRARITVRRGVEAFLGAFNFGARASNPSSGEKENRTYVIEA